MAGSISIQVKLPPKFVEMLDKARQLEGLSRSAWIRKLIVMYFKGLLVEKKRDEKIEGEENGK